MLLFIWHAYEHSLAKIVLEKIRDRLIVFLTFSFLSICDVTIEVLEISHLVQKHKRARLIMSLVRLLILRYLFLKRYFFFKKYFGLYRIVHVGIKVVFPKLKF